MTKVDARQRRLKAGSELGLCGGGGYNFISQISNRNFAFPSMRNAGKISTCNL